MDELPVDVFDGMTAVLDGCSMQTWTENVCGICLFGFSLLVYIFVLFFVLLFVCLLFLLWLLILSECIVVQSVEQFLTGHVLTAFQ